MAIGINILSGSFSDVDGPYTTASISPSANSVLVVMCMGRGTVSTPSVSGLSLSWVTEATSRFHTVATPVIDLTVFSALTGGSPGSGALTITYGAVQTYCQWSICEFTGVNTTDAILQPTSNQGDAATSLTVTLGAFSSGSNATYGAFGNEGSAAGAADLGAGFTVIHNQANAVAPVDPSITEYLLGNDTSVDSTDAASHNWGGVGLEVAVAAAGTVVQDLIGGGIIPGPR